MAAGSGNHAGALTRGPPVAKRTNDERTVHAQTSCRALRPHHTGSRCRRRGAARVGAGLSDAEHHLHGRLRGRRHCRRHRAHGRAEADRAPRAYGGGREPRRRRRQSRGQGRERGGRRRLHHSCHHHRARGQRERLQEQGLLDRRSARHRDRGVEPGRDRRSSEQSRQGLAGVRQQRQGQELHLWQRRRRHRSAYRRGIFFPRGREGQGRACSLYRRRAGGAVRNRQSCRCDCAHASDGGAADHPGPSARHRAGERDARFGGGERADLRRDGLPQRLFRLLGRLLRAGEDARCGGGEAQRRDQPDHEGSERRSRSSRPSASKPSSRPRPRPRITSRARSRAGAR